MIELTDRHFQDLCSDQRVRGIIDEANRNGRRAVLGFWAILILGLGMIGAATIIAINLDHLILGVIIGSVGVLVVYILAVLPLAMAGRAIKLPVFEILAARNGLDYAALVHAPSVYEEARPALFGTDLVTESFTDFFSGKTLDGCDFATCQAYLHYDNGSSFNGRLFAFDRASEADAASGKEARVLLDPEARRICPDLRLRGKLRIYAGPDAILVAVEGRKGFTPGLGFRFRRGEERIRWMFDDLADSLATLRRLKASLDPVL